MHKSKVAAISVSVALAAMLGTALAAPAAAVDPRDVDEPHVTVEYFPEPGGEGRRTEVPVSTEAATGGAAHRSAAPTTGTTDGEVGELAVTGPSADRLDVVIIGDGYTADQQDDFHAAAAAKWGTSPASSPTPAIRV